MIEIKDWFGPMSLNMPFAYHLGDPLLCFVPVQEFQEASVQPLSPCKYAVMKRTIRGTVGVQKPEMVLLTL